MVKFFRMKNNDGTIRFEGYMLKGKCSIANCDRHQYIPFDYCNTHLESELHLQIRPSNIPNAGMGVFAFNPALGNTAKVFSKGEKICAYIGEQINDHELNQRYGELTAPYCVKYSKNKYIDGALIRGIGTLFNTNTTSNAKNKANLYLATRGTRYKIGVKAIKDIKNNEEIYVSYGDQYRFNDGKHETLDDVIDLTNDDDDTDDEIKLFITEKKRKV